jgi:hypothetical protein
MNTKEKNEYLIKCLGIEDIGFELIESDDDTSYTFKKSSNKITFFLNVIIISNKLYGMGTWLVHDEVEELISKCFLKHNIPNQGNYPMTITFNNLFPTSSQEYRELDNIPFIDEEIISYIGMVAKIQIIENFTPLWEKYSDLQIINDELIDKIPQMQLAKYISGEMPLKKLIIMRMCKNQNYTEYKNWLMGNYTTAYEQGTEQAEKEYFMLKDLIEYIESVY